MPGLPEAQSCLKAITDASITSYGTQKTPWSAFASWTGVVLVVVGGLAQGYIRDQDRLEANQNLMSLTVQSLRDAIGQNRAIADNTTRELETRRTAVDKIDVLEQEVSDLRISLNGLDTTLQREMRLLDDSAAASLDGAVDRIDSELAGLDTVLQREMRLLNDASQEKMTSIAEMFEQYKAATDRRLFQIEGQSSDSSPK